MFEIIAIVAIVIAIAIAIILILAATKPDTFSVQRATTVKATPEKIFSLINDFHQWGSWSPYENKDPAMKRSYSGAESGKGAVYAWDGNKNVGSGRMEILDAPAPRKVAIHRYLDPGFVAQFQADGASAPQNNAALFSWEREDRMPPDQGGLLKLRRPVHRTFHVVAWEASCKLPNAPSGQPPIAPEKIAIGGDSAGGGLTLATITSLRDAGRPLPGCSWLVSPWVDLQMTGASLAEKADVDPLIQKPYLEELASAYLAGADPAGPLVSPLHADLGGLPPLLVQVGSAETLLDDALRIARRAGAADVPVSLEVWPHMIHAWHLWAAELEDARRAIASAGTFMRARM